MKKGRWISLLMLLSLVFCQGMAPLPDKRESGEPAGTSSSVPGYEKELSGFVDTFQARDIFWDWEWTPFIGLEESINDLKAQGVIGHIDRTLNRIRRTHRCTVLV